MVSILKPTDVEKSNYFHYYIYLSEETELMDALLHSEKEILTAFSDIKEGDESFYYAEGKWTIKQLLKHISDTERIMAYRILRMSRGDKTAMKGYDEDEYAMHDYSEHISLADIIEEFKTLRQATKSLIKTLNPNALDFEGNVNGSVTTARRMGWIIAGHGRHHLGVLKDRYLKQ